MDSVTLVVKEIKILKQLCFAVKMDDSSSSESAKSRHDCIGIGCQYSDGVGSWFPVLEENEESSRCSWKLATSNRIKNHHLHSRVDPTQACERSCIWSGIKNSSMGCAIETTVTIYRKIWEIGACTLMQQNKNFLEYVQTSIPGVKFIFHEDSELLRCEWADNPKNRGKNSIMQVTLTWHFNKSELWRVQGYHPVMYWDRPSRQVN